MVQIEKMRTTSFSDEETWMLARGGSAVSSEDKPLRSLKT